MTDTTTGFTRLKPVQPAPTTGFTRLKPVTNLSPSPTQPVAPTSTAPVEFPVTPTPTTGNPMLDFQQDYNFQPAGPKSTKLTVEQVLADPIRMGKVRKMMAETKDQKWATAPDEEVLDSFMTHMRWVNANEASTAAEWLDVAGSGEERKATYGGAYEVYNEIGSIFENGDSGWQAVKDYTLATVTAPSTIFGLGVGKLGGAVASRAGAKALQQATIQSAKTVSTPLAAKAVEETVEAATKMVVAKTGKTQAVNSAVVKQELRNFAAKGAARAQVMSALTVEAGMAGFQDYMYQDLMMQAGVQDDYSFVQTALSGVAGSFGAIPAIAVLRSSADSTLGNADVLVKQSFQQRAASSAKRAAPRVKESITKATLDWQALVKEGVAYEDNSALQRAVSDWFFDVDNEDSLIRILHESGAQISFEEGEFTKGLISYGLGMGDEALTEFNKAFEPLGVSFGEAVLVARKVMDAESGLADAGAILAGSVSAMGRDMGKISRAARWYKEMQNLSVSRKRASKLLKETKKAAKTVNAAIPEPAHYFISWWKKMLVSNPITTVTNVIGWGQARVATSLADMTIAAGLMGRAGVRAIAQPGKALKDVGKARQLLAHQTFAMKTLVDPFLSAEAFFKLLDNAPTKITKKISGQIYGGVDNFTPEKFGLDGSKLRYRAAEAVGNTAQMASFVHLQDTLTKGISGLTALDKESRTAFGKGIEQLILDGETYKLTDEMWDRVGRIVLQETFSEDLGQGKAFVNKMAKASQWVSQQPVLGFYYPFGNFVNNVVAFSYRHSPISLAVNLPRVFKKQQGEDLADTLARGVVGTVALGLAISNEMSKQEEGLQWFEKRNADGSVRNIQALFPENILALTGRIIANAGQGEGMDSGLMEELNKQLVVLDALESAGAPGWLQDVTRYLSDPREPMEDKWDYLNLVGGAMGVTATEAARVVIGGATRPLAPYNSALSLTTPEAGGGMIADPKQAEGFEAFVIGASRNTTSFFNYFFGEETEYGTRLYGKPKQSALSDGPVRMTNPAAALQGNTRQPPATAINKVLGMVDKQPFRAESFTSGNPEFDDFINTNVTPLLEREAQKLLNDETFLKSPQWVKMERVGQMITNTRNSVVDLLEGNYIIDSSARVANERRKLETMPRAARIQAKIDAGIETDDNKLSLEEIERIRLYMEINKSKYKLE